MARRFVEIEYAIVMITMTPTSGCSRGMAYRAVSATMAAATAAHPMIVRSLASYGTRGGGT